MFIYISLVISMIQNSQLYDNNSFQVRISMTSPPHIGSNSLPGRQFNVHTAAAVAKICNQLSKKSSLSLSTATILLSHNRFAYPSMVSSSCLSSLMSHPLLDSRNRLTARA